MATKDISQLDPAVTVEDADLFMLRRTTGSQNGIDVSSPISQLSPLFNLVDIHSLVTKSPLNTDQLVITDSLGSVNNKVVVGTLQGHLFSAPYFPSYTPVLAADTMLVRQGATGTVKESTVEDVRSRVLTFSELPTLSTVNVASGDLFSVYDASVATPKRLTKDSLRQVMLETTGLNSVDSSTIESGDKFIVNDSSATAGVRASSITFTELATSVGNAINAGNLVDKTSTQTISGEKTFSNVSGIKTDKVAEATVNSGVNIDGVLCKDSNVEAVDVSATNVDATSRLKGKWIGSGGSTAERFMDIDGNNITISTAAAKGFQPLTDDNTVLGRDAFRWKNVYSKGLNVDTTASLPTSLKLGGTSLLVGGKVNTGLLPTATTSALGSVSLAAPADVYGNTDKALTSSAVTGATRTYLRLNYPAAGWTTTVRELQMGVLTSISLSIKSDTPWIGVGSFQANLSFPSLLLDDFLLDTDYTVNIEGLTIANAVRTGIRNKTNTGFTASCFVDGNDYHLIGMDITITGVR